MHKQRGFSVLHFLLLVIVVGIIIGAAWYVYRSSRAFNDSLDNSGNSLLGSPTRKPATGSEEQPSEKWLTYNNDEAKLTFQYPETWKSRVAENERYDDGMFWGVSGSLTSTQGRNLEWVYMVAGGKGGSCEPTAGDVAFQPGNKCASKQILSVEKTHDVTPPKTDFRNLFQDALYITHTKYMSDDGNIKYHICLDPYYKDEIPQPKTTMGLVFPCEWWSTGFNAKFQVADEAAFKSDEAKTAERIMKTFDSL